MKKILLFLKNYLHSYKYLVARNKEVKVEVLDVQETVKKDEAKELFRYL